MNDDEIDPKWQAAYDKFKIAVDTFVAEAYGPTFVPTDWTSIIVIMDMASEKQQVRYVRPGTEMYPHVMKGLLHQALNEVTLEDMGVSNE